MHGEAADQHVLPGRGLRERVTPRFDFEQCPLADQLIEQAGELLALVAVQSEFAHKLLVTGGAFWLALNLPEYGGVRQ